MADNVENRIVGHLQTIRAKWPVFVMMWEI